MSTETYLIHFIETIRWAIDKGLLALSVSADIINALDGVSRGILLNKIYHYDFRQIAHELFPNDLHNRQFFVQIDRSASHVSYINLGVPQGFCLGPLLFLLFVNDLPTMLS